MSLLPYFNRGAMVQLEQRIPQAVSLTLMSLEMQTTFQLHCEPETHALR